MVDDKTKNRAQFLLHSILDETQHALAHLHRVRPRIFARGLAHLLLNVDRIGEVRDQLREVTESVRHGDDLDWGALEKVGLTGSTLEWKTDLIFLALGRLKPKGAQQLSFDSSPGALTYAEGKPVWSRLFRYLKSLFGSLINGVKSNSTLRFALDFIKEFIECVEASLKFVQAES
jgi:hypothetical protein